MGTRRQALEPTVSMSATDHAMVRAALGPALIARAMDRKHRKDLSGDQCRECKTAKNCPYHYGSSTWKHVKYYLAVASDITDAFDGGHGPKPGMLPGVFGSQ